MVYLANRASGGDWGHLFAVFFFFIMMRGVDRSFVSRVPAEFRNGLQKCKRNTTIILYSSSLLWTD